MSSSKNYKTAESEPVAAPKAPISEHAAQACPYASGGRVVDGVRRPHVDRWKHEAAAALHGWAAHAHHQACEMELTAEDYASAVEAACILNDKGIPTPHKPALYAVKA